LFLLPDFIAPNQIYPADTSGEEREEGVADGVEWPGLSSMKTLSRDGIVTVNKLSCFMIFPWLLRRILRERKKIVIKVPRGTQRFRIGLPSGLKDGTVLDIEGFKVGKVNFRLRLSILD
jgi:hypothetical protein